jgi:ppGpp synthetase/RelA/SpoT-type nucleotidyltranferase
MLEEVKHVISTYQARLPTLQRVAEEIKRVLEEILYNVPRIDRVVTRVKDIPSFSGKAEKIDPALGVPKYKYPLQDIQDQIGARIVVFYKSDVAPVIEKVLSEIHQIENQAKELPAHSFGYEAHHLVCVIPPDIRASCGSPIDFFELQVSTLFQYAWAQASHDIGYKSRSDLSYNDQRLISWAASQAWGADLIFDDLWKKPDSPPFHAVVS